MTEDYIRSHFGDIQNHACDVEKRLDDSDLDKERLIQENLQIRAGCEKYGCKMVMIEDAYPAHFSF